MLIIHFISDDNCGSITERVKLLQIHMDPDLTQKHAQASLMKFGM